MREHPILFSAPMVRAILEGRKSVTRRVLKTQPMPPLPPGPLYIIDEPGSRTFDIHLRPRFSRGQFIGSDRMFTATAPYAPGDRLWVREAWRTEARHDHLPPRDVPPTAIVSYEADYDREPNDGCRGRYRPPMFMLRWASRITLEVTGVKVERLQDISEEEAKAEGPEWADGPYFPNGVPSHVVHHGWRARFAHLWDSINAKRPGCSWDDNPWVAAISFRRLP
jgi:hypothetical protein